MAPDMIRPVQPSAQPAPQQREPLELRYARQTRNAAVFIAWVVGIGVFFGFIGGIYGAVQIAKIGSAFGTSTSTTCDISNPDWPNC